SQTGSPVYAGRYTWTGRERDPETGLQYNRARYYDPFTARWMSQDPLGFDAGDSNLYRYVGNSEPYLVDPSGMQQTAGSIREYWNDVKGDPRYYKGLSGTIQPPPNVSGPSTGGMSESPGYFDLAAELARQDDLQKRGGQWGSLSKAQKAKIFGEL